jgi:hypothetical protein
VETGDHDEASVTVECPDSLMLVPEFPSPWILFITLIGFALVVAGIRSRMPPAGPR